MRKLLIISLFMFISYMGLCNDVNDVTIGKIALNAVLIEEDPAMPISNSVLLNKLKQSIVQNGMAGSGFDDRFIITAHPTIIASSVTNTYPQKSIYELGLTFFIGDGIDGTLFSSYYCEIKGMGESKDETFASAYKKLNIKDANLINAINEGKSKIVDYYNTNSGAIIKSAQTLAASGKYDEAISKLTSIPSICNNFDVAMELAADYAQKFSDITNMDYVLKARTIWSTNSTTEGAEKVVTVLNNISMPSDSVIKAAESLTKEISDYFAKQKELEWKYKFQVLENEKEQHSQKLNTIQSIATAFCNNRPQRRFIFRRWWW